MNKGLFNALEATQKYLEGNLDSESKRYLERHIIEKKLDGERFIRK